MFYSYAHDNGFYTKAVSLEGVRTIQLHDDGGKRDNCYSVRINYFDTTQESFNLLSYEEATNIYHGILIKLNNGA